jgi:hypothetical protein
LRRLGNLTDSEYNTYQLSARARLTDVYNKYEAKYGDVRLRRPVVPPNLSGKKRSAWDEIYDNDEGGGSASGIGIHPLPATLHLSRGHAASSSASDASELISYLDCDTVS